jgi:hypothetical protein
MGVWMFVVTVAVAAGAFYLYKQYKNGKTGDFK